MNQKIADMRKPMNDLHAQLKTQSDILKRAKSVDDNSSFRTASSSATTESTQEPLYGMPMNCANCNNFLVQLSLAERVNW